VTPLLATPSAAEVAEATYLATPRAVRDRAEALYRLGVHGELAHFTIDETQLGPLAERVVRVSRATYPDPRAIPNHTRFRHFGAGGIDRVARLDAQLAGLPPDDRLCAKFELAITSVLLDAGAGGRWAYREPGGETYTRSEGLAVASYHLFVSGALSDDPVRAPHRADASALARFSEGDLARAFQVGPDNPLVGLDGRALILRRLGEVIASNPQVFRGGAASPRLGGMGVCLASQARAGALPASTVLGTVLDALGDIWPGREVCAGRNLGDVWTHPAVGRVPFHKLSQWLTYSLCEPLEQSGVRITGSSELTGLAEYRNGGLFVDGGVLVPKHRGVLSEIHDVSSPLVVEWRGLTVALLDRIAGEMRRQLGLSAADLSLAQVLEGGTWRAGRELARERRPEGAPPIGVHSDGTVF
jgi:Protein of unknown function (DUF1688)